MTTPETAGVQHPGVTTPDAAAQDLAKRLTARKVKAGLRGNGSFPDPYDLELAIPFIQDLLAAGWTPPRSTTP